MRLIVTDKLARRQCNFRVMIEIELPCCEATTHVEELADTVHCERCGVVLELEPGRNDALPIAA